MSGVHDAPNRRTPILLGVVAVVLLIAVVVALGALFQRGQGGPAPAAPAGSTTAPGSDGTTGGETGGEPAPAEPEAAASVSVTGTGFTVTDADGSTFTHAWADDAAPAIEALTEVFGEAPTEDFQNGDAENWAYDIYNWSGFRLYDVFLGDGGRSRSEVPAPTFAMITGGAPESVSIVDEFGVEIGDSIDEVRSKDPVDEVQLSSGGVRLVLGEGRGTFYSNGDRTFSAFVVSDAGGSSVASITYTFRARGQ
ncbi:MULTISPECIES: hypothetical protein [unclassified Microbacterium]|uniref:hypothetical protein n=1 Tax=unclassified Microbacterium TaxID=2609290 RepID=UPI00386F6157